MNIFRAVLSSSNLSVTSVLDSLERPNPSLGTVVSIARSVLFGRKRGCEEDTVPGAAKVHRAEMPIPPSFLDPDRNRFPQDILRLITNYLSNSDIKKLPPRALVDTINTRKIGLKALGIATRQETATWLKSLGEVRETLSYLDLSDIPLTAELIALLPSSLQELKCCNCALTDEAVAALSARCTKLLKLDVGWNRQITGNTFGHLPEGLQELKCEGCTLTDKAVAALSARCTKLLKLDVSRNLCITGNAFDHLPEGLQELKCGGCTLTDEAVAALSARCTKLLKLDVCWNSRITGNTFDHLPEGLQELGCWECTLTDEAVPALSARGIKLLEPWQ